MKEWAIYIDIEGFGKLYLNNTDTAYRLLTGLVTDVYYIMERIYPEPNLSSRDASLSLIAHQFGDGVIILPGPIGKEALNLFRPICICIALLRTTAMRLGFAKAAISYGGMVDYRASYPREIYNKIDDSGSFIKSYSGVMTILTSMGEGLIRSYNLSKKVSGPLLIIDSVFKDQIKDLGFKTFASTDGHCEIDWINSEVELVNEIIRKIESDVSTRDLILNILEEYVNMYDDKLSDKWKENALKLWRGKP